MKFHKILVYKETLKKPGHAENLLKVLDISNATAEVAVALQFFQRMWSWMRRTVDKEQPGPLKEICTKKFFSTQRKIVLYLSKNNQFFKHEKFFTPNWKNWFSIQRKGFLYLPKNNNEKICKPAWIKRFST